MRPVRLLIVASPYESALVRRAAERANVDAEEADAEEVEAVLAAFAPDVVVVAAALPAADGKSVLARVRAVRGDASRPRILALGGAGTSIASADEARSMGADGFAARPVDPASLVDEVLRAAGRAVTQERRALDLRDVVSLRIESALEGVIDDLLAGVVGEAGGGGAAPKGAGEAAAPVTEADAAAVPSEGAREAAVPSEGAREAAVPADLPPVFSPEEIAASRARLQALLPLVEEGDYFAILGLPRETTAAAVVQAWRDLRRALDAAAQGPGDGERQGPGDGERQGPGDGGRQGPGDGGRQGPEDDERRALEAARRVVDEACRILGDDASRERYLAHLAVPSKRS